MSWQAMEWVLKHSRSKGASRLVALAIAYHVDKDGKPAFPSAETIAEFANIRRASVFPCLDILYDLGELDWIQGGGSKRTNLYTLKLFASQASLFENSQQNGPKTGGETVRSARRNSQNHARKQSDPPDTNRIEPKVKPASEEKTQRATRAVDPRREAFLQFASESFGAKHDGHAPVWNGKDHGQLAELLRRNPDLQLNEIQRRWTHFVSSSEPFIRKQGDSLAFFCSRFDSFIDGPILAASTGGKNGNAKPSITEQEQRTRRTLTAAGFEVGI